MAHATDLQRIADLEDPVLRNVQITQAYHDLAHALRPVTGPGANWCAFATWASKQAGKTIRHEDLERAVMMLLRVSPEIGAVIDRLVDRGAQLGLGIDRTALREAVFSAAGLRQAVARAGNAVGRGNLKVFAELAPIFSRYVDTFAEVNRFDADTIARFAETLRPGEPPDGQEYLREAFTAYVRARFEADYHARAQSQFRATLLIGAHEQIRLQPDIADALNAPFAESVTDARQRLLSALLPGSFVRLRYRLGRSLGRTLPLDRELDTLIETVRKGVRELTSRHLMTLHLPDGTILRLGRDLRASFPESLQVIRDPQLQKAMARFDPTPDSLADTGALDWSDFADRMHFILDYFRCYFEDGMLFHPPFTIEQAEEIRHGRVPDGPL